MKEPLISKGSFKLIALDMDGTLLNNKGEVSEENRLAIEEAKAKGVHVVLATGRSILTCRSYADSLQLSSYLVTVNGSEIWDHNRSLVERIILHSDHIQRMWELTQKHNTRYWAIATDKIWRQQMPSDIANHQWLKFGFDIDGDEIREAIFQELSNHPELEVTNSGHTNIEVNAIGVHKARGLQLVCKNIGISMSEVIAMGDSLNDIAMIKGVGCGVAMGNAQETVKQAADWVTGTNEEDGVAQAIRHWVL